MLGGALLGGALHQKKCSVDAYFSAVDKIVRDHQSIYANPTIRHQLLKGHADYGCTSLSAHLATARVAVTGDYRQTVLNAQCTTPTLILHGEDDPVAPVAQSEWLSRKLQNAQLIKLPGVGHVVYAEREQAFSEILSKWIGATNISQG